MKTLDMTKGEPLKIIIKFMVPIFIGLLFQQIYNIADTVIVGIGIGEKAMAAMGVTASIYNVLINFASGLNSGYSVVLARVFGMKDIKRFKISVASMLFLNFVISFFIIVVSLPLLKILLDWLETPKDIYNYAYQYIFIIICGMLVSIAYNMGAGFMQAIGNSKTPLVFLIIACITNIILDILFVFVFNLGIKGVGFATVLAQLLCAFLCYIYILKNYKEYLPSKEDFCLKKYILKDLLFTGISVALTLSLYSIGSIILQKGINKLGVNVIAAHTASRRFMEMCMMPIGAFAIAMSTFSSQNYGAKKYNRIKEAVVKVLFCLGIWSIVSTVFVSIFGKSILGILIKSKDKNTISLAFINWIFSMYFFIPLSILNLFRNVMQTLGDKISPILSSAIELVVKLIFALFIISRVGYMGVVVCEPIIWVLSAVYMIICYLLWYKKFGDNEKV